MWDILEVTHEGTYDVRRAMLGLMATTRGGGGAELFSRYFHKCFFRMKL